MNGEQQFYNHLVKSNGWKIPLNECGIGFLLGWHTFYHSRCKTAKKDAQESEVQYESKK